MAAERRPRALRRVFFKCRQEPLAVRRSASTGAGGGAGVRTRGALRHYLLLGTLPPPPAFAPAPIAPTAPEHPPPAHDRPGRARSAVLPLPPPPPPPPPPSLVAGAGAGAGKELCRACGAGGPWWQRARGRAAAKAAAEAAAEADGNALKLVISRIEMWNAHLNRQLTDLLCSVREFRAELREVSEPQDDSSRPAAPAPAPAPAPGASASATAADDTRPQTTEQPSPGTDLSPQKQHC